jgi:predicted nucleic acid-binding protein
MAPALDQVAAWLESPTLVLLGEGKGYFDTLKEIVQKGKVAGPQANDARIAALCKSHSVTELCSADRDFRQFPSLRLRNSLIG